MIHVEAVAQPRHTGSDLVELDALLASICKYLASSGNTPVNSWTRYIPRFLTYMVRERRGVGYWNGQCRSTGGRVLMTWDPGVQNQEDSV